MKSLFDKYYTGFIRAPLFWAAALFSLGIALGLKLDFASRYSFIITGVLAALFLWLVSRWKKVEGLKNVVFLSLGAGLVMMGAFYYGTWLPKQDENILQGIDREQLVRARLAVKKTTEIRQNYSRVLGNIVWLDKGYGPEKISARLWLNYYEEQIFFPGDEIIAWVYLRPIKGFKNPFVPDPSLRFARGGIYFSAAQVEEIPILKVKQTSNFILPFLYRYREKVSEELDRSGARSPYLLSAMLLGERDVIPDRVWKLFQATNSSHILVISGFNLTMVAGFSFFIVLGLFRIQPWLLKRMNPYPWAGILSAIPTTFYAVITGLELPTFRALIMVLLLLIAIALRKTRDLLNALGLAGFIILLIDPSSLFDASFQLSFLAVFVLILYYPAAWKLSGGKSLQTEAQLAALEKGGILPRLRRVALQIFIYIYATFLGTVLIQSFLLPLNAYYFSQISLSGPFSNLLLIPICGFWVYPIGIAGLWTVALWPGLAARLFQLAGSGAWLMEKIAGIFAGIPHFNLLVRAPAPAEMFGWFVFLFGLLELIRIWEKTDPERLRKKFLNYAAGLAWVSFLFALAAAFIIRGYLDLRQFRAKPEEARITMLDVGLGQSLVIELPGKKRALIDGGGRLGAINLGQAVVSRFLLARGIRKLDMVILTHPETDHSAGLEYILDRFEVKEFCLPDRFNKIAHNLLELAGQRKIKVRLINSGQPEFALSSAKFKFLNPPALARKNASLNDSSAVIKMEYRGFSALFPGEISSKVESELVDKYSGQMKSQILVAGHHGSKSSSSAKFLSAVSPRLILISAAESFRLKLPSQDALRRMAKTGAAILRTDIDHEIEIIISPQKVEVRTFTGKILPLSN